MGTSHIYENTHVAGNATAIFGDYQPTHVYYGEQRQDVNKILVDSLLFERWDARLRNVVPALDQTCEWMLSHPHFQAWLESGQTTQHGSFLWLKGKPGSGKSTVMKKMVEWAQRDKSDCTVLSYFFNARSPRELEKSSIGLYRSLTYQLLSAYPDGATTFVQMFIGKTQGGRMSEEWTVAELQSFWLRLVTNHKLPPCFMFVDALDEGSEDDIRSMIDFMIDLVDRSLQNDNTILTFLSSRYYPSITIEQSLPVLMEEQGGHEDDIRLYISKKLKGRASPEANELQQLVFVRSYGVFLWVVLAVPVLNKWYDQGCTTRARVKKLETIPVNLHDIFDQILFGNSYDSTSFSDLEDMQKCIFLFRWVLFSLRPLRPDELSTAVQTSIAALEHNDDFVEAEEDEEAESAEVVERRLIHLSRGLIELTKTFDKPVVQLIHETVRDFLLGKSRTIGARADQRSTTQHEFITHFDACACHCAIAKACLSRLIAMVSRSTPPRKQDILASYAAEYWWRHVEAVGGDAGEEVLRLATELLLTPSCLQTWLQIYNIHGEWHGEDYEGALNPNKVATPLYYAAIIGYKKLFNAILDQGVDVNAQGGRYGNALQAASAEGHETMVQMLLDNGANINAQGGVFDNALVAASVEGRGKVVQILLDRGADVNAQGAIFGNALIAASTGGHETVVQILLDNGANVNAQGGSYGNALQAASARGHETVVRMLLDNAVDVNFRGGYFNYRGKSWLEGDALHAATFGGYENIVDLLRKAGAS